MNEHERLWRKAFGMAVRMEREKAGLDQVAYAKRLLVTQSSLSRWERGTSLPDAHQFLTFVRLAGIDIYEFTELVDKLQSNIEEEERIIHDYERKKNGE